MTISGFDQRFNGPFLKVRSAKRHINNIYTEQQTYFGRGPFEVFDEVHNGLQIFKARSTEPHPEEIDAAVADVLSNLRSSLDTAVTASALIAGAEDLRNTYFHTASSENEWDKSVKGRTKAAPANVVAINRQYRPWPGGNDLLSALARLAVVDKHQLLTPIVLGPTNLQGFVMTALADNSEFFLEAPNWDVEKKEAIIGRVRSGKIALENVRLQTYIGFGQVGAMAGEPIIPVLNAMADMCQEIIETIAAAMVPK